LKPPSRLPFKQRQKQTIIKSFFKKFTRNKRKKYKRVIQQRKNKVVSRIKVRKLEEAQI